VDGLPTRPIKWGKSFFDGRFSDQAVDDNICGQVLKGIRHAINVILMLQNMDIILAVQELMR
jgi:hypothetical protein